MPKNDELLTSIVMILSSAKKSLFKGEDIIEPREKNDIKEFFGEGIIKRLAERYGLDQTDFPKDINELRILICGIGVNFTAEDIQTMTRHFGGSEETKEDKKARAEMQRFLLDHIWTAANHEIFLPKGEYSVYKYIQSLKNNNKKAIAMEYDFLDRMKSRHAAICMIPYASEILSDVEDVKKYGDLISISRTKGSTGRETSFDNRGEAIRELRSSLHSEIISKGSLSYAYTSGISEGLSPPQGQVIPIPNEKGEIELYKVEHFYNKDGLVYNIVTIVKPKNDPESQDIMVFFRGTADTASKLRNKNSTYLRRTPGRNLMEQHGIEILDQLGECAKKLRENENDHLKVKICGHSLGGADAQYLAAKAMHVIGVQKVESKEANPELFNKKGAKSAKDTIVATKAQIQAYKKTKGSKEGEIGVTDGLHELPNLRIELGVWGAPGIFSKDNKAALIIMDKLKLSDNLHLHFSHVGGDPIKKIGTHLGALRKKSIAETEKDYRSRDLERMKIEWSQTGLKRFDTHTELVWTVLEQRKREEVKLQKEQANLLVEIRKYVNPSTTSNPLMALAYEHEVREAERSERSIPDSPGHKDDDPNSRSRSKSSFS